MIITERDSLCVHQTSIVVFIRTSFSDRGEKQMNSYQAKKIPLSLLLDPLGHQPHHEVRGELWYKSPFRQETEPSFQVNEEKNLWYDEGYGKGGTVIDFVMSYYRFTTISFTEVS